MPNLPKTVQLDMDKPRTFIFNMRVKFDFEDATGKNVKDFQVGHPFRELATMVLCMLKQEDPSLTYDRVAELIHPMNILDVQKAVAEVMGLRLLTKEEVEEREGQEQVGGDRKNGLTDHLEIWAIGRYDLRLTEEEFWSLHPVQFMALLQRKHQENRYLDMQAAKICALINNRFRDPDVPPATIADFMLTEHQREELPQKEMTSLEVYNFVKSMNAALGGTEQAW